MIGLLRLGLLVALAAYVLGRPRTRGLPGLTLVAVVWVVVIAIELSGWTWANLAESAIYGLAGGLVIFEPPWLLAYRGFAHEYRRVDREVWQEILRAEHDWRADRMDDAAYSRVFDRTNVRYRALQPPPGEWSAIVQERIRIREGWSQIFANPKASSEAERAALGVAEKALRRRIARAG